MVTPIKVPNPPRIGEYPALEKWTLHLTELLRARFADTPDLADLDDIPTGGGGVTDHGDLDAASLLDDDHPQYSRVDGTRPFTAVIGGIDPTSATHLTTRSWVEAEIATEVTAALAALVLGDLADVTDNSDVDSLIANDAGTWKNVSADTSITIDASAGTIAVNLGTNPGLQISAGLTLLLATNPGLSLGGPGLSVLLDTNPGLQLGAGGLSVDLDASSGLQLGAGGLSAVAGDGIAIASDVSVDEAFDFEWTGEHEFDHASLSFPIAMLDAGGIKFHELTSNGTNSVNVRGQDSIITSYSLLLPDDAPTNGQLLQSDASAILDWVDPTTALFTDFDITAPTATQVLQYDGVDSWNNEDISDDFVIRRPTGSPDNLVVPTADTDEGLILRQSSATQSANLLQFENAAAAGLSFFGSESELEIAVDDVGTVGQVWRKTTGQTADYFQARDESDIKLFWLTAAGQLFLKGLDAGGVIEGVLDATMPDEAVNLSQLESAAPDELRALYNGASVETVDVDVTESGGTVSCVVQQDGGGDVQFVFGGTFYTLDCTPAASVALTAGTDIAPQLNYVYVTEAASVLTLTAATGGFPSTSHAPIATVMVQSAASVSTDGAYKVHVWTDHIDKSTENGHLSHLNAKFRALNATWQDGVAPNDMVVSSPDAYISAGSGNVYQLHTHAFPARDMQTGDPVFLVNDPTTKFKRITTFDDITQDGSGGTINNKWFSLVLFGIVSEDAADCKLFLNLPTDTYSVEAQAQDDINNTAVYSFPTGFTGTAFLIARYVVQGKTSGAWVQSQKVDLRGTEPASTPGGGGTVVNHDDTAGAAASSVHVFSSLTGVDVAGKAENDVLGIDAAGDVVDLTPDSTFSVSASGGTIGVKESGLSTDNQSNWNTAGRADDDVVTYDSGSGDNVYQTLHADHSWFIKWEPRATVDHGGGSLFEFDAQIDSPTNYSGHTSLHGWDDGNQEANTINFTVPRELDLTQVVVAYFYFRRNSSAGGDVEIEWDLRAVGSAENLTTQGTTFTGAHVETLGAGGGGDLIVASLGTVFGASTLSYGEWVKGAIFRDATAGNADDTWAGTVQAMGIEFVGTKKLYA